MRLPLLVCDSCLRMWCDGSLWTRLRREKGLVWWEGLEGADRAVLHPMSFKFDAADYDVAFAGAREKALGRAVRRYRPAVGIPPACQKLFQYASSFVTPTLIHDHCMNDPGFADYVREYLLVLRAGPPARPCFDFWETLSDFVYRENDYPDAGQRFACFLFSAALASSSCARSEGNDRGYHAERITGNLLAYALALGDRKMLEMLSPAFLESYAGLGGTGEMDDIRDLDFCIKEVPYLTLARLALAHMGCAPQENKSALLEQLMQEAREHEWDKPTEHRWERPTWAKLPGWWRDLIEKTYPENARPLPDLSWQAGQA